MERSGGDRTRRGRDERIGEGEAWREGRKRGRGGEGTGAGGGGDRCEGRR